MLFFLLTLGGLYSFKMMKIQNFPDLDFPTVTVRAELPGASPPQLEAEVARKIENSVATLQGLKHTTTQINDGIVNLTLEFRLEKSLEEALDDTRSAVSRVRADLPGDLRDPIVKKLDVVGMPILAYALSAGDRDVESLSWLVDDLISRRLLSVPGVASVNRVGGGNREISIALDPYKLQSLGVSAADVSRQLRRIQRESAGGRTELGEEEQPVRTLANLASASEFKSLPIVLSNGLRIRLDQLAEIKDTMASARQLALLNGRPVVGFEISRSRGASEVEVGEGVRRVLADLKAQDPELEFNEAFNFVTPVSDDFHASISLLFEGAALAVVVVWLFLRDRRATFISAIALPLSAIPTFIGMYALGFSLNVVSLLALSLVVGILVDDAIVEVENIVRHLQMGKKPYDAAMEAANEIGLAVIATTFALIAVFLPTAFMNGVVGRFFKQFGWTAALAVFASLVVARMLTPMMAAYLMKPLPIQASEPGWLMRRYLVFAELCLKHRFRTLAGAGAFFIGSLMLIPLLPKGFIPAEDGSQTQVFIELPPGATLEKTRESTESARQLIQDIPYIKSVYATIGGGTAGGDPMQGPGDSEVRKGVLTLTLMDRVSRPIHKQAVENLIRERLTRLPGVRTKVGLGGSGEQYVLTLSSEDPVLLAEVAHGVEREIRTIPGIGNISSSASLHRPEIAVRPDFDKAADLGVTSADIAETLRIATLGDYEWSLPKLNLEQRQIPVMVRLDERGRHDLRVMERLSVPSAHPERGPVLLRQVADLELSSGPAVIRRYDRVRNISFDIELSGIALGDAKEQISRLPALKQLPQGVHSLDVGDAEMMQELFGSFGVAMLSGILCIFVVLVLLFKDFLQPISILAALPLAFGGGFVALLLAGKAFSMPSLIGLVMLMGIATKNSILLVEYAMVARREHGMERTAALIDACSKRARPVIMTTIAMGAGMLPIALGLGSADASFRSPMAYAVIGGLVTSTILSLIVIPPVYTVLDDLLIFTRRFYRKPEPRHPALRGSA